MIKEFTREWYRLAMDKARDAASRHARLLYPPKNKEKIKQKEEELTYSYFKQYTRY